MNKATHAGTSAGAGGCGRGAPAGDGEAWQEGPRDHHAHEPGALWRDGLPGEPGGYRVDGNDPGSQALHPGAAAVDADGMTVAIGGFAVSAGEVSMATGVVDVVAQEGAGVSISRGTATFDAYGYGQQPGEIFAATDAYLQVFGADLVVRWACESAGLAADEAWSHSEIDYLAIDVFAWSPSEPIVIDLDQPTTLQQASLAAGPFSFAATGAAVEAHGEDVLSLTSTYAFTNSQLSFVYAMALASL